MLQPPIRRNIKLAEAPSFGQTIFDYSPWCKGAIDYRKLARGLIEHWHRARPQADETPPVEEETAPNVEAAATVVEPKPQPLEPVRKTESPEPVNGDFCTSESTHSLEDTVVAEHSRADE